jgi:hypothetical protein
MILRHVAFLITRTLPLFRHAPSDSIPPAVPIAYEADEDFLDQVIDVVGLADALGEMANQRHTVAAVQIGKKSRAVAGSGGNAGWTLSGGQHGWMLSDCHARCARV